MNIHLSAELETYVRQQVESGQFSTPDEVVATALAALKDLQEADHESIWRGIQQAEAGLVTTLDEVRDRLMKRYS